MTIAEIKALPVQTHARLLTDDIYGRTFSIQAGQSGVDAVELLSQRATPTDGDVVATDLLWDDDGMSSLITTRNLVNYPDIECAYMAFVGSTIPYIQIETTGDYVRLIRWDGTAAPVYATAPGFSAIPAAAWGAAPAAPYNSMIPKGVAIYPCDAAGNPIAGAILKLMLSGSISAFSGERLPSLTLLEFQNHVMQRFTCRGMPSLRVLRAPGGFLTNISLSHSTQLLELNLLGNRIESFAPRNLPDLQMLSLFRNRLSYFDGSGLKKLQRLSVGKNKLTYIDVSMMPDLIELDIGYNNLSTLSLVGAGAIEYLSASYNPNLTSIDATGCTLSYGYNHSSSVFGSGVAHCALDAHALDAFYASLNGPVAHGVIDVQGNPGSTGDDPSIATAKGYTIIGT